MVLGPYNKIMDAFVDTNLHWQAKDYTRKYIWSEFLSHLLVNKRTNITCMCLGISTKNSILGHCVLPAKDRWFSWLSKLVV
ncbi:hypothetical protein HanRHA438_Chr06g0284621 [Helianthus annuus]|nr:hypothetical protein HanRHA438_Chr06g0284621 [Helianthus annuus]